MPEDAGRHIGEVNDARFSLLEPSFTVEDSSEVSRVMASNLIVDEKLLHVRTDLHPDDRPVELTARTASGDEVVRTIQAEQLTAK
jgi:hypothetical protein